MSPSIKFMSGAGATRLPELDGLRAIAILLVLIGHHLAWAPVSWLRAVVEMGWVGVDLFFVLSGFLIGGILLDQRTATNYYRVFYLRRFFRIVPLYAVILLPGLLVLALGLQKYFTGHSLANQPVGAIWFCPFFLQNVAWVLAFNLPGYLSPTWSVAVEEQFYLLLPPLVRNVSGEKLLRTLAVAIIAALALRGVLIFMFGPKATLACYVLLPCRWDALLLGAVCALAWRDAALSQWLTQKLHRLQMFWWLTGAGSIGLLFTSNGHLDPRVAFLGYTLIDAFFASTLLLAVMNHDGSLKRLLCWPGFKPIAAISYGLYLLQSPMLAMVGSLFRFAHIEYAQISWDATGVALLSLALTFVAAACSWKFFESRMIQLGHQFTYRTSVTGAATGN